MCRVNNRIKIRSGKNLRWDELLKNATGESLNPKYFSEQFVE